MHPTGAQAGQGSAPMKGLLPVTPAHRLATLQEDAAWLVEGLWSQEGVGIIGGEPKCCKSFLALDLAVAVASRTPCLRRFAVDNAGRVLLFAAEDALHVVRARLEGIAQAAGARLEDLDIQVITAASVRLDLAEDRERLAATVAALSPRLVILDPFVRLHRVDENLSGAVAPLLAFLRELQRAHHVAVAVVHHARKGAGRVRAGQALRGSSEFHAWGDSNLYLRRHGEQLTLSIEHRAAASPAPMSIRLCSDSGGLALRVHEHSANAEPDGEAEPADLGRQIETALKTAGRPLSVRALRSACRVRTARLSPALSVLTEARRVFRTAEGYVLASYPNPTLFPVSRTRDP